jgi:hypothetical protein
MINVLFIILARENACCCFRDLPEESKRADRSLFWKNYRFLVVPEGGLETLLVGFGPHSLSKLLGKIAPASLSPSFFPAFIE